MLKAFDTEGITIRDDSIRIGLNDSPALAREGHSLMRSFLTIRDPSIRRLIVDMVVEMARIEGSPQISRGTGQH